MRKTQGFIHQISGRLKQPLLRRGAYIHTGMHYDEFSYNFTTIALQGQM